MGLPGKWGLGDDIGPSAGHWLSFSDKLTGRIICCGYDRRPDAHLFLVGKVALVNWGGFREPVHNEP